MLICYKCGKRGHNSNKCTSKAKINEINDEGLKQELMATFINETKSEWEDNYFEEITSDSENP